MKILIFLNTGSLLDDEDMTEERKRGLIAHIAGALLHSVKKENAKAKNLLCPNCLPSLGSS